MEKSVGSTIEEIKLQEQDKEIKLKEKRELDATKATLLRAIRDSVAQSEKAKEEILALQNKTDRLRSRLEIEKIHKNALALQIDACSKELEELRAKSDQGISEVWNIRASLSEAVHSVADECDLWALLMKPSIETKSRPAPVGPVVPELVPENEGRLKEAIAKRERMRSERDRLLSEPDVGDEYLRIKNALRYSLEMTTQLKKAL